MRLGFWNKGLETTMADPDSIVKGGRVRWGWRVNKGWRPEVKMLRLKTVFGYSGLIFWLCHAI